MTSAQLIAALIGTGGIGSVLTILARGIVAHMSGAAGREQRRQADAITQRDDAWARADRIEADARARVAAAEEKAEAAERSEAEAQRDRRVTQEYASALRGVLLEHGITPPPWPTTRPIPTEPKEETQ